MSQKDTQTIKKEQKRSREIIERTRCTSMCVSVSLSLRIWFIPQRVLLFLVLARTQRQHHCISAHPASPRERSRCSRSICLSASAPTQTRTDQISLSLRCIPVLVQRYGNLSERTSLLFKGEGLLDFHISDISMLEGSLEACVHKSEIFTVVCYI